MLGFPGTVSDKQEIKWLAPVGNLVAVLQSDLRTSIGLDSLKKPNYKRCSENLNAAVRRSSSTTAASDSTDAMGQATMHGQVQRLRT